MSCPNHPQWYHDREDCPYCTNDAPAANPLQTQLLDLITLMPDSQTQEIIDYILDLRAIRARRDGTPMPQRKLSDAHRWVLARHLDNIRRADPENFPLIQALEAALALGAAGEAP
jgi:hypothetical protein